MEWYLIFKFPGGPLSIVLVFHNDMDHSIVTTVGKFPNTLENKIDPHVNKEDGIEYRIVLYPSESPPRMNPPFGPGNKKPTPKRSRIGPQKRSEEGDPFVPLMVAPGIGGALLRRWYLSEKLRPDEMVAATTWGRKKPRNSVRRSRSMKGGESRLCGSAAKQTDAESHAGQTRPNKCPHPSGNTQNPAGDGPHVITEISRR